MKKCLMIVQLLAAFAVLQITSDNSLDLPNMKPTNNSSICIGQVTNEVTVKDLISNENIFGHNNNSVILSKKITNNAPIEEENITHDIPHKCCPEGFIYVPRNHGCQQQSYSATNDTQTTTRKIGLSHCRIIRDYFYSTTNIHFNGTYMFIEDEEKVLSFNDYCIDNTLDARTVVRVCEELQICKKIRCLHKCCPDGQSFVNGSFCRDTFIHGIDINGMHFIDNHNDTDFAIIHRNKKLPVYLSNARNNRIDNDGIFYVEDLGIAKKYYPHQESYCIEHATKNQKNYGHVLFRINNKKLTKPLETKYLYLRIAMIISELFLAATILLYILLKETRNVFGKALVSFCIALFIFYAHLIYLIFKLDLKKNNKLCISIAFSQHYFGFSAFLWLQILCFDIYWTFGSSSRYQGVIDKKRRDFRRFMIYSIYGWILPILLICIPIAFYFTDILPDSIKIKIGVTKCFIENENGNYAEVLFKTVPLTLIEMINLIYFIKTVIYIWKVKSEINKMNDNVVNSKKKKKFFAKQERFKLVIKLYFTMGTSYLFEVISSFYNFQQNSISSNIEIVWDVVNCLQGLFIFIIFVCKMKNFKTCRDYLTVDKVRKISLSSTTRTITISSQSTTKGRRISKDENRDGRRL